MFGWVLQSLSSLLSGWLNCFVSALVISVSASPSPLFFFFFSFLLFPYVFPSLLTIILFFFRRLDLDEQTVLAYVLALFFFSFSFFLSFFFLFFPFFSPRYLSFFFLFQNCNLFFFSLRSIVKHERAGRDDRTRGGGVEEEEGGGVRVE